MENPIFETREKMNDSDTRFSKVIKAGRRTYFFDVKTTRNDDHYIVITESRKKQETENGSVYEKQKLFLYKEDFDKFMSCLKDSLDYVEAHNSKSEHQEENDSFVLEPVMSLEQEFELL